MKDADQDVLTLDVQEVEYIVNNNDELIIKYNARTDKPTIVNLTNHSYFNLNGCKALNYNHELQIMADNVTAINSELIPTGKIEPVAGTPLDFRNPKKIGKDINNVPGGYDHNYVVNGKAGDCRLAGKLADPDSGRTMEVHTSQPGMQFYSANFLDGSLKGKNGIVYNKHMALCLETQHYPDSPNHPAFPTTQLKPGDTYYEITIYKFGKA